MFGLAISCATVATMVIMGYLMHRSGYRGSRKIYLASLGISSLFVITGALISITTHPALAAAAAVPTSSGAGMGFIGVALATGLACVGAGLAVSNVGSAALGLVGEKPEMLGTTLIYLGLAEGIAIYGVIVSLLILGKL